jgi:hypothetical protein
VDTVRLEAILQPSAVVRLLDSFILSVGDLPTGSRKIRDQSGLSSALRCIVARAEKEERVWSCWTDGHKIWLFTAEMSLPMSRERGVPVLQANWYGEYGEATKSGSWVCNRAGKWLLCSN